MTKVIKIENCFQCSWLQLSKPFSKDDLNALVCRAVEKEDCDYVSKYDDIVGRYINSMKNCHKEDKIKELETIPEWCSLDDLDKGEDENCV